jgi:hypothetical protein
MQPRIKVGLIVGAVGLVLNICVSAAIGLCGPAVSLVGGAIAGFLAARQEQPATQGEGAKIGAISAAIAGALILIGQVIAAVGALALIQFSGMQMPFGQVPSASADPATQAIFYLSGLGTGVCFGLIGVVLAALAGAGTGYLGAGKPTAN